MCTGVMELTGKVFPLSEHGSTTALMLDSCCILTSLTDGMSSKSKEDK